MDDTGRLNWLAEQLDFDVKIGEADPEMFMGGTERPLLDVWRLAIDYAMALGGGITQSEPDECLHDDRDIREEHHGVCTDCGECVGQMPEPLALTQDMNNLLITLQEAVDTLKVCSAFEVCEHEACQASYSVSVLLRKALAKPKVSDHEWIHDASCAECGAKARAQTFEPHELDPLPGGVVDHYGVFWPTCRRCGRTHRVAAPEGGER